MKTLLVAAVFLGACAAPAPQSAPAPAAAVPEPRFLPVETGRIYFEETGRGTPVVLIHGGFGDRRMWDAQFNSLGPNFRVIRYDHRGFGNSVTADSPYSPVTDLVLLFDHLGIARAHVIGNSVGGGVALDFAVMHPDRVHKVVVVASGASGVPYSAADVADIVEVFNVAKEQGTERAAGLWLKNPMIAVASKAPHTSVLVRSMVQDNRNIFRLNHWPEEKNKPSAFERLGELKMPVLFVIGEKDTPVVKRVAEASAARINGAQVFRIPGADHLPQMTHPEEFNRRLLEFLY